MNKSSALFVPSHLLNDAERLLLFWRKRFQVLLVLLDLKSGIDVAPLGSFISHFVE